jgi:hypothetical protein
MLTSCFICNLFPPGHNTSKKLIKSLISETQDFLSFSEKHNAFGNCMEKIIVVIPVPKAPTVGSPLSGNPEI